MKTTATFLTVLLFSLPTFAANETVCTKGKLERRVAVVSTSDQPAPCEVRYYKDDDTEGKVLWNAKNKLEYCTSKAQEFVQKLGSFGWTCKGGSKNTAQVSPATETPGTPTDEKVVEEIKKKKKENRRTNPKADTETPAEPTAPAAEVKK